MHTLCKRFYPIQVHAYKCIEYVKLCIQPSLLLQSVPSGNTDKCCNSRRATMNVLFVTFTEGERACCGC